MLKFQIGADEASAGCVLAIPAAVWDSWQRHLGQPELMPLDDDVVQLRRPGGVPMATVPAWIYVFDIDSASRDTPNPIVIQKIIATDADSVAHYAVKVAPEIAIADGGAAGRVVTTIRRRIGAWWPALVGAAVRPRGRRPARRPPGGPGPEAPPP